MTRPVDPNISIPSAFAINGTKTDFTNEKIQDGFDDTNPDILAGDNLNKFIDDTYKGLNYSMDGVDDLYDVTDDLKDLSNLSASGQAILNNKANKDLSNLSSTGEAHFANPDLSNLSASGQAILDSMANISLSNLSTSGDNRLHALKGYLDNGELLTDAEGLADVVNYAHSTFDLSKFTVTGTPTITDDGIASGFVSLTNFLNATYTSTTPTASIDIWTKVIITDTTETSGVYWAVDGNLRLMRSSATAIGLRGFSGALSCDVTGLSLALNDEVIIHANVTGTNATVDVWINGVKSSNSVTHSNTIESAYSHLVVGGQYSNGNYSPLNSIDLKYQRVLFDGVEVFSGNKTGIDTYTNGGNTVTIPYTLSKTGSKIVNSLYRTQVTAVYNEYGYAPYYTLDEANGNFTLPQGEIYGMMLNQFVPHVIESYVNQVGSVLSWYRVYSDGWCVQGAWAFASEYPDITTETTINLLKPYKNVNYYIGGVGFVIENTGRQNITAITPSSFTTSHDPNYPLTGTNSWWTAGFINI